MAKDQDLLCVVQWVSHLLKQSDKIPGGLLGMMEMDEDTSMEELKERVARLEQQLLNDE